MKYLRTVAIFAITIGLAGCVSEQRYDIDGEGRIIPPDSKTALSLVERAYGFARGRAPVDPKVTKITSGTVIGTRPDVLICATTAEKTLTPLYNNAGELIEPIGTPYTQNWILLTRKREVEWGVGIFRRIEAKKIGDKPIEYYCP